MVQIMPRELSCNDPVLESPNSPQGFSPVLDPEELMEHRRNAPAVLVLAVLCLVFIATPAYAYIDPNAAGLVSQILTPLLIAAAAGLTFLRKQIGATFSALFRRLRRRADVKEV
jgi:hypothetical protein